MLNGLAEFVKAIETTWQLHACLDGWMFLAIWALLITAKADKK